MNSPFACLMGLALMLGAGGALAAQMPPHTVQARLPDGRMLSFQCAGTGKLTVLLESGWAADGAAWRKVMPLLPGDVRVCAYDRAGSGGSDAGPLPRDGAAIAKDLDDGLRAAGISGPYLLVGHSAGGLYNRHFALRRPRDVAGMVLADSSIAHQQARFEAVFGPGAGSRDPIIERARQCLEAAGATRDASAPPISARCRTTPAEAAAGRWTARLSEVETLAGSTSSALDAGEPDLAKLPLVVLTAGKAHAPQVLDIWAGFHREIAALSACGTARVVPDSGHMMIFDRPDAIADAVNEVVALVRAGKPCGSGRQ